MSKDQFSRRFSAFLIVNALFWNIVTVRIINLVISSVNATEFEALIVWGLYNFSAIISSLIGVVLLKKMSKPRLLYCWFFLGIIASMLPFLLFSGFSHLLIVTVFFGIAFGFGMPVALSIFADSTEYENRGFNSGIIFFITYMLVIPLVLLFLIEFMVASNLSVMLSLTALFWRALGFFGLFFTKPLESRYDEAEPRSISFKSVFRNRAFVLCFIPWFMAALIDRFEEPILSQLPVFIENPILQYLGVIFVPISALVGGFLADRVGRKKVIVYGFVSLGIAYAVIGIASQFVLSLFLYILVDGITWGIFFVCFILVVWGDLSPSRRGREKYYVVGAIPWFVADFTRYASRPFLSSIPAETSFSIAAFFLFLAVIPLIYAPETMPEKTLERRKMVDYIEKAKKFREKHAEKS